MEDKCVHEKLIKHTDVNNKSYYICEKCEKVIMKPTEDSGCGCLIIILLVMWFICH